VGGCTVLSDACRHIVSACWDSQHQVAAARGADLAGNVTVDTVHGFEGKQPVLPDASRQGWQMWTISVW